MNRFTEGWTELPGFEYGLVLARLTRYLVTFVDDAKLGAVSLRPGLRVPTDGAALQPDISFVARERVPEAARLEPILHIAPDLAVEIVPPNQAWSETEARAMQYVGAGTRLVWIVNAYTQAVHVYGPEGELDIFSCHEPLTGDPVLPGFSVPVERLFDDYLVM